MSDIYSIYGLVDPRDLKVFYIGKTSRSPLERFEEHIKDILGESPKQKRIKAIYDGGGHSPELVVLESGIECPKSAFTREIYWIEIFRMSGTVLTNASVDYDGVHFLTESHFGPIRKEGLWSVDITDEQLDIESSNQEYFQIESYTTFTPIKSGHSKSNIDFAQKRNNNLSEKVPLNHDLPITAEEIMLVQYRYRQGDSIEQLKRFFQRSRRSVDYMIGIELEEAHLPSAKAAAVATDPVLPTTRSPQKRKPSPKAVAVATDPTQTTTRSPLERELEPLLSRGENAIGELMKRLETGYWKGTDAVLVAGKLKALLEQNGSWLPEFNGSNKLKKKKHERTLRVIGFLGLDEK